MNLEERTYSVLIISQSETFVHSLSSLLLPARFHPQQVVTSAGAARRAFSELAYDLVVINARFPDDPILHLAKDLSLASGTAVLLLVPAEFLQETKAEVQSHGVFTLDKPVSRHLMEVALSWLIAAHERLRRAETRSLSLEDRMQKIRLINRAKWALIDRYGWTESQAHHHLEKLAMDKGLTKREAAEAVLEE